MDTSESHARSDGSNGRRTRQKRMRGDRSQTWEEPHRQDDWTHQTHVTSADMYMIRKETTRGVVVVRFDKIHYPQKGGAGDDAGWRDLRS